MSKSTDTPPSRSKGRPSGVEPKKRGRPARNGPRIRKKYERFEILLRDREQHTKLLALGGSDWVRQKIDQEIILDSGI